ncbi:B-cell receptor CD22-like isoform X2 [Anoplopoma fimbria]|uniref:B-cell receptor CD22-like isoform X2 n=1 Tax=Anoplopoma fimbria TaxID=229290 RepID=UPI0023ECB351|nr:B-cell receptor CD22-like isoform X2 [Anoplopoma fimbria]
MSLTAAVSGFVVFLLSAPVIHGQDGWRVTYTPTKICAVGGSTVEIRCSYTYPYTISRLKTRVEETFWFTKVSNDVFVDLRTDPEYSGRVQSHCGNNYCTLTITNVRESDSAEYKFMFTTNQPGGKYTGDTGVSLSVTDLQVQVNKLAVFQSHNRAELTCQSSCLLPGRPPYVWYNNGQKIQRQTSILYLDNFNPADSISCAVGGYEDFPSPSLLIHGQDGWRVTYTSSKVCALKGSTVEIHCSYTYPYQISGVKTQVEETFWFTKVSNDVFVDLRTDPEYSGRVQYDCRNNYCTLTITNVRESDSAEYKFMFSTNQPKGKYVGEPGVSLSVTDLQVQVNRLAVYQSYHRAELTCQSSCLPPGRPLYVWNKNGQKIQRQTSVSYSDNFNPSDSISCAEGGYEDFPSPSVYAPKLPSVSVSPSDEIVEGSSVTLTCSSDANPAANYTWYKEDEDSPKASGQIFTITDIRTEHSGNYSCEAQNNRGRHNSTFLLMIVAGNSTMIMNIIRSTLVVLMLIPLLLLSLWTRKKKPLSSTTEPHELIELDSCPVYEIFSEAAAQTEDTEEQEDRV